jgi:hypothetical protein
VDLMALAPQKRPDPTVYPIASKPGIKRDGTAFEGAHYVDGQWVRFQRGLPRKMGGYRQASAAFSGPVRGCYANSRNAFTRVYAGSGDVLEFIDMDETGFSSGVTDRTPVGFAADANNVWQFDALYNAGGTSTALIAHAAPNLADIASTTETPVYYGDIAATTALSSTGKSVSGGACVLHPYLFIYGNDGYVSWSDANAPATFGTGDSGEARVAGTKIVKGLPTRGGPNNSPAGLLWSLNSLIRVSYAGGTAIFRFDQVAGETSVLSSSAVIEYDGVVYWISVDRFLMYNGIVRELPNDMNINHFFDNLNWTYRQKVWAMKVPRFGEIWFFYPSGTSTECNAAIIYNVRENVWYDPGSAPGARRSAGYYSQVFRYPLMFGSEADEDGKVALWQHEFGTDEVVGQTVNAIKAYIESADIALPATGAMQQWVGIDLNTILSRFEPDFVQSGNMTLTVRSRPYANAAVKERSFTFGADREKVDVEVQGRIMRLRFTSNVAGGSFQMGQPLLHLGPGDGRPI